MDDVVPELLKSVLSDYKNRMDSDEQITSLLELAKRGNATYKEANAFAIRAGEILADSYKSISSDILPDGKMYYNIADRLITETMHTHFDNVADVAEMVQNALNEQAEIGIKAIRPTVNEDRIKGLVNKVSSYDTYDDVAWALDEPVVNFSQNIIDSSINENAKFQYESGMKPKIVRTAEADCCDWCTKMAGVYDYPVERSVFRRHQRCRCIVEYHPRNGKVQNSHTKVWRNENDDGIIELRKAINIGETKIDPVALTKKLGEEKGLADRIIEHPKMFGAYTPKGLKASLERAGYEVLPLGRGKLEGIPFENGGGYRVCFGGNKYIQYHPKKYSHHGVPYYKVSQANVEIKRYELNGESLKVKKNE